MILKPLCTVSICLVFLSACAFTGSGKKAETTATAKPIVIKASQQETTTQKPSQESCTADTVCTLPSLRKYQQKP